MALTKRFFDILEKPHFARDSAMTLFALGVAWPLLASMINISPLRLPGSGKELGYVFALNWSITYSLILPCLAYTTVKAVQSGLATLERLPQSHMLYHRDAHRFADTKEGVRLRATFKSDIAFPLRVWIALSAFALVFCLVEWWTQCGDPVWNEYSLEQIENDPRIELDWCVASQIYPDTVSARSNFLFSLCVFVFGQAAAYANTLFVLIFGWAYVDFLKRLASDKGIDGMVLIPSLDSSGARCGFEQFEEFGKSFLALLSWLFVAFYLVILSNQFLNHHDGGGNILGYTFSPYIGQRSIKLLSEIIAADDSSMRAAVAAITVLAGGAYLFAKGGFDSIARTAKRRLIQLLQDDTEFVDVLSEEQKQRSKSAEIEMETWPFEWLSEARLRMVLIPACGGVIFFRLFPSLFFIALSSIVAAVAKQIRRRAPAILGS